MPVNIRPYPAKVNDDEVLTYSDHFSVEIPYAGKFLKWDVLFNDEDYNFAPDFVFSDQFLADPDIDVIETHIPSLANWDVNDPNSLQKVLQEILLLYKKYQVIIPNCSILHPLVMAIFLARKTSEWKQIH